MLKDRERNLRVAGGAALAVATFALYLATMAPTLALGWRESGASGGELLAAAETLGIPHPPGYPTYTLLLKGFAEVAPVGDFAFRGNLLSAVLAAASVVAVYWVTLRVCRTLTPRAPEWFSLVPAALAGAVFAAAPVVWSQAVVTGVHALNAALVGFLLLVAVALALPPPFVGTRGRWRQRLLLAAFGVLTGTGLGNHPTLLAAAVPLLVWIGVAAGWRTVLSPWLVVPFLAGVSVYAYLPIRAAAGPPVNWGGADTVDGFLWMLTAPPYREHVFGIAADGIADRATDWMRLVFDQLNPLGLFFGLMGAVPLLALARPLLVSTLASILIVTAYATLYDSVDSEALIIPALLMFSVWLGVGLFWIMASWMRDFDGEWNVLGRWRVQVNVAHQAVLLSVLAIIFLPVATVVLGYSDQDLRGERAALQRARAMLDAAPDGSVLVSSKERNVASLLYARYVDRSDRDVTVIAAPLLRFGWYLDDLHELFPERVPRIYTTDVRRAIRQIVEHNVERPGVYFTYASGGLLEDFQLTPSGPLYSAAPRGP